MLSVLIVDDEAPIREWVEYCINREKGRFSLIGVAATGEEAFSMAEAKNPQVVITDIRMPGMNGLELIKKIKELSPYTVFVILTNYADFSYAKEAISYGVKEYLLKSEMRAQDLIGILGRIEDEKEAIMKSKKEHRFPNGFVDLYDLYQAKDEAEREKLLGHMGFQGQVAYQSIFIQGGIKLLTAGQMAAAALEEGVQNHIGASRNQDLFFICQDARARKLADAVAKIGERLGKELGRPVGISLDFVEAGDFLLCLKQAVLAENYHFFQAGRQVLFYGQLMELKELDYGKVRDSYHKVLMDLSYKQYDQAHEALGQWFSMVKGIRIQDSQWARERCQRMVLAVEEQCCCLDPSMEAEVKKSRQPETLEECQDQCAKLVLRLFQKKKGGYSESIDKALQYIHQNYNRNISLVDVAGSIYRSPEYFSRLFKEEVGENFSTYLMLYRLNHAKELLRHTDKKIWEISCQVGYSTQSYFSRLYKKYMGKTPEEERGQGKVKL